MYIYIILTAGLVSAIAAVTDYRSGRIPNWLTLGAFAIALVGHVARGGYIGGFSGSLTSGLRVIAGALACSLLPLFLYRKAGMGGGDLKLLAAIGGLCGPSIGLQIQFYAFVVVLFYAFGKLAFEGKLFGTARNCVLLLTNPFRARDRQFSLSTELLTSIRFGPSVFAATLLIGCAQMYQLRMAL
jgi:prepilin peptidase CpaA